MAREGLSVVTLYSLDLLPVGERTEFGRRGSQSDEACTRVYLEVIARAGLYHVGHIQLSLAIPLRVNAISTQLRPRLYYL